MSEPREEITDKTMERERSTEGSDEERGRVEAASSTEGPKAEGGAHGSGANVEEREATAQVQARPSATPEDRDDDAERAPLLPGDDAQGFRQRWENLQGEFVDQPREVVERADELVSELMQTISTSFSEKRSSLEAQWERGDDVSTEDLRVALTRYRSFFNRLLSA